jgi:hypothetical protein
MPLASQLSSFSPYVVPIVRRNRPSITAVQRLEEQIVDCLASLNLPFPAKDIRNEFVSGTKAILGKS